jgi:hypothetical protein
MFGGKKINFWGQKNRFLGGKKSRFLGSIFEAIGPFFGPVLRFLGVQKSNRIGSKKPQKTPGYWCKKISPGWGVMFFGGPWRF